MEKDRSQITDRILNITLEIIYLLTGEDYVPSKKAAKVGTSISRCRRVSESSSRSQSPNTDPSPPSPTTEENDKKILQLTNKIIELMSAEVPIRCQDVAVYLSMEEWEYYEGNKEIYTEAMMDDHQPQCLQEDIKSESCEVFQPTFQSTEVISEVKILPEPIPQTEYLTTIYNPSEMPGRSVSNESDDSSSNEDGDNQDGHSIEVYIKEEPSSPPEPMQTPQRFYSCSECPKLFAAKADMMRHQRLHEKKALTCNQCGKIFPHKAHLLRHQCVYTAEQSYICSQCGESFLCKSHLVTHLRIHTGEKPLVCQDCGKHFSCNSALITHRRMHTGEKPYKCNECGKEYVQKHSLVLHQKFHTENKPFSCPECSASFFRQSHLDNHRKTHKGMRRYTCPDCGDFFMLLSSLIIHQKIHSAEKPFSS